MSEAKLCIRNPYSEKLLAELPYWEKSQLDSAVLKAQTKFRHWRKAPASERAEVLTQVATLLEQQKEDFARLICDEAGKPIQQARGEVARGISVLQWAAAETQRFSGELLRLDLGSAGRSGFGIHTRFPSGVVLGITPFNFPLNLVLHKIAPAIACGCTILIKPSPFTPLTALKIAGLFEGISPGLVQVVLPNDNDTAELTRAPEIAHISFTGSSKIGWQIREQAPKKKTTLELGGNAWVIVNEDTPPELFSKIAKRISVAAFGYAGQSCISVQNVAVAESIWSEFKNHLVQATEDTAYGDPTLPNVVSGPVINEKAGDRIRDQLKKIPENAELILSENHQRSTAAGTSHGVAHATAGTKIIIPSLIILNGSSKATVKSDLVQQEIFAPVMTARKFNRLPELIEQINSSHYGLQAGVYTQNLSQIEELYRDLEVGGLIVNDVPTTRYDHQPYGGVKESGQGREGIRYAMEDMTESKFLALSSQVLG